MRHYLSGIAAKARRNDSLFGDLIPKEFWTDVALCRDSLFNLNIDILYSLKLAVSASHRPAVEPLNLVVNTRFTETRFQYISN